MRFITIGSAYVNVDCIESIRSGKSSQLMIRQTIIRTKSGDEHVVENCNDLSKSLLDKVLDSSGGFKEK